MAISTVGGDLDFQKVNAILNVLVHPIVGDVTTPTEGQLWYNSTTETLRLRLSASTVTLASGGGIGSVVEDTAPVLGGNLDISTFALVDGARELLTFIKDAAAVNELQIENEATGGNPILRGTGGDVNVGIDFESKGAGTFDFAGDITVTGTVDGRDVAADGADGDDLVTLSGVAANSTNLATFTGTTIADAQTIKAALQALETAVEAAGGVTNLSIGTRNTNTTDINSDTGTNATIPAATTTLSGLQTGADKTKLDGIEALADVTPIIDDDTMASATATNVPSAESTVAYIAAQVAGFSTYKGGYNASTNTPNLDATPIAIAVGDQYTVTAAGTFFTIAVEVGDLLIAEIDSAAVEADWTIVNRNLDVATETVAGIVREATQAEIDAGTDVPAYITPDKLVAKPRGLGFNSAATATTTCTHNFGTADVLVELVEVSTGQTVYGATIDRTSVNAVDVTIVPTPTASQYRILILNLIA